MLRCCENCLSFLGRNEDGEPICGALFPTFAIKAMHDLALQGTNALCRCTDYRANPRADDDEEADTP